MACPACGSELSLEHLLGSADDERAFARLVALSVPLAHLVVRYIALFAPPKQRLTLRKKVRLIAQILPDLQRAAITHKGRDWPAPHTAWGQAIDQMLGARDAGRLDLPMAGHGYLYAILAGMADKHEAQAEQAREHQQRTGPRPATVGGSAPIAALAVQAMPAEARPSRPVPTPAAPPGTSPTVRAMRAALAARAAHPNDEDKAP